MIFLYDQILNDFIILTLTTLYTLYFTAGALSLPREDACSQLYIIYTNIFITNNTVYILGLNWNIFRQAFAECTILTIAHRLKTIMDSNRVIVMDAGRIKEFDTPARLLRNKKSMFYGMAKEAGVKEIKPA